MAGDRYQNGVFVTARIWDEGEVVSDEIDELPNQALNSVPFEMVAEAYRSFCIAVRTERVDNEWFWAFEGAIFAIGKAIGIANLNASSEIDLHVCAILSYLEEFEARVANLLEESLIEVHEGQFKKDLGYYAIKDAAEGLREIVLNRAGLNHRQFIVYRSARAAFDRSRPLSNDMISEEENLDNFYEYFDGFYRDSRNMNCGNDA